MCIRDRRNSSAQFGEEYWDGPVQSATSIEIKAAYVAGTCFELQQGTIAQSIEVADGDYYVGCLLYTSRCV